MIFPAPSDTDLHEDHCCRITDSGFFCPNGPPSKRHASVEKAMIVTTSSEVMHALICLVLFCTGTELKMEQSWVYVVVIVWFYVS